MEFLQKQLKNLKDALKKCLDKRNQTTRSGAAASTLPKCKFFEQMAFLHEKIANKATESNVGIPSSYQAEDFGISSVPSPSFSGGVPASHSKKVKTPAKKARMDSTESMVEQSLAECHRRMATS